MLRFDPKFFEYLDIRKGNIYEDTLGFEFQFLNDFAVTVFQCIQFMHQLSNNVLELSPN